MFIQLTVWQKLHTSQCRCVQWTHRGARVMYAHTQKQQQYKQKKHKQHVVVPESDCVVAQLPVAIVPARSLFRWWATLCSKHRLRWENTRACSHTHANSHAHTHTHMHSRTLYQLTPARKTEETLLGWRMGNKHKYPVWVHTKEEGAAEGGAGRSSKGGLALQTPSSVWFKRPSEPGSDLYWLNQPFVLLHCTGCSARCLCFCVECALLCTVGRSGLSIW